MCCLEIRSAIVWEFRKPVAKIIVETEEETDVGWHFVISIGNDGDPEVSRTVILTMSWADYDLWSAGGRKPSDVATDVIAFAVAQSKRGILDLRDRFDASIVRRQFQGADEALRGV